MYFSTLTLLFASTALITAAPTLPRPRPLPRQAPPQSADDIPAEPPFQVLTCQAQSIVVRSEWNTAFITSDETYSHYGDRTLTVPLNGCRDLQATVNAYDVNAAKEPTPINSLDCVLQGAPWGADAKLNLLASEPWYELVDADGVNVTCTPVEAQQGQGEGTPVDEEEAGGETGSEGEGSG